MKTLPIEISARHIHCDDATWKQLFGTAAPTVDRAISQPPQFVAKERVHIIGPKGTLDHVGVVGPLRAYTQVELATTDARKLGLTPPLRESGHLEDAAILTIVGPMGQIEAPVAILQQRHIHANPQEAQELGVKDGQEVSLEVDGPRGGRLDHVVVRIDPSFELRVHVDTDEANALGIQANSTATLVA